VYQQFVFLLQHGFILAQPFSKEVITEGLRLRLAVRGLIMSPTNSVLLVKIKTEESGEFWALPGGGKEGNETDDVALLYIL
jgi:8-oxo-dGTP pyrophosphatase MutT (NUDIX family)